MESMNTILHEGSHTRNAVLPAIRFCSLKTTVNRSRRQIRVDYLNKDVYTKSSVK